MKRLAALAAAFAAMVAGIEGLRTAVAWWRGELATLGWYELLLLALLPVLLIAWWRFFSIFGRKNPKCLTRDE
ncbi:MAG: hypothetical protein OHK0026_04540 [Rhodocyclaceae bacterium]